MVARNLKVKGNKGEGERGAKLAVTAEYRLPLQSVKNVLKLVCS